jgi:hypothetical protein
MFRDKITVIIQGPLHPNSLVSVRTLAKDFNIIISTWKTNTKDEKNLDKLLENGEHVTVVSHNIESLEYINNDANRFYQFYGTLRGLLLVETEFAIKMRADEYYTDLIPLAEAILANPDKMVSNEVFFRNPESIEAENFIFHPSDHLFGGKTSLLKNALELCVEDCRKLTLPELESKFQLIRNKSYHIVPEQHLFANFIQAKFPDFKYDKKTSNSDETLKKTQKENCVIVPSSELGFYCVSYGANHSFYPREDYFNIRKDLKEI